MILFCLSPLIPKMSKVIMYFSEGILIVFGIYSTIFGKRMKEARNLPATALFCLSSNHFGSGLSLIPKAIHFYLKPSLRSINVVPINSLLN